MFYVYSLFDPINKIPFYVGKGKGNRAWAHTKGHANYNTDKLKYIQNIRILGFEPIVHKIVENIQTSKEALKIESFFINYFEEFLTNKKNHPPDRTGSILSEKHKQRLSFVNTNKKLSKSHKEKIGYGNSHVPNYNINKKYVNDSILRNEGSKNPNSKKIEVNGLVFGCISHAYKYFGVCKSTFKKRYNYTEIL